MLRTKLIPLSIVASLALPTLASARIVEGVNVPSARQIEEAASSRESRTTTTDTTEYDLGSEEDVEFSDVKEAIDGYGGGGMYMPPYYGGGISIDVSTTKTVTPDTLSITGWCDAGFQGTRTEVKDALKEMFNDIKADVGADGKVRRTGGYSVMPYYDPMTGASRTGVYSGNLNLWVDVINFNASERIADVLEEAGCSVSWNVSLKDMQAIEYDVLDDLLARLNRRKDVFEKLLKTRLDDSDITGAYLSSWIDSWSSYDPDSNTATATITLSVTFMNDNAR